MAIWEKQEVSEELKKYLSIIAEKVYELIIQPVEGAANIVKYCKKPDCCNKVKSLANELSIDSYIESFSTTKEEVNIKKIQDDINLFRKKTNISEYNGAKRKQGVQAIGLREGDSLISVWIDENSDILIFTKEGMCIRFDGSSIGPTGRIATGVQGIKLTDNDEAAVATCVGYERDGTGKVTSRQVFIGCSDGSGKRVMVSEFTRQNRAGRGLKFTHSGQVVSAIGDIEESDNLFISGDAGAICVKANDIALGSRISASIKVIKGSKLLNVVRV